MSNKNTYYVEIQGERYECRVKSGDRQIRANKQWLGVSDFITWLESTDRTESILDLAEYGHAKITGKQ